MRASDWEIEREDRSRFHREQAYLRSLLPVVRSNWGGRGSRLGATKRGDGDDWLDVRPRRRKALRQGDRGKDGSRRTSGSKIGTKRASDSLDLGIHMMGTMEAMQISIKTGVLFGTLRIKRRIGYGLKIGDELGGSDVGK